MTEKDSLTEDLEKAIQDYNPDQVLVVGGPKAISPRVESQVNSLGYETVRIAGETRYDTASKIAKTFWENSSKVFVVRGRGEAHADALSVGRAPRYNEKDNKKSGGERYYNSGGT